MRRVLLTSWDDGLRTDLKLGQLLADHGFKGTFYATTGPSGAREIADRDLERLVALGHEIGNHGLSHRDMTTLTKDELLEDVAGGHEEVERFMKAAPIVAPPCGFMNGKVVATLVEAGFLVRTAAILGKANPRPGVLEPTAQIFPHSRRRTFLHQLKHRSRAGWPVTRAWYGSTDVVTRLERIISGAEPNAVVHIWGHSGELDKLELWDDLARILARAREAGFTGVTLADFYTPASS